MNDVEAADLARCEKVIKRTRVNFIECGQALAEIRDKRLYRANHKNFPDYCADVWSLSKSHAYRMIDASAQVSASPIGDVFANEHQARKARAAQRKPPAVVDETTTPEQRDTALEKLETPDEVVDGGRVPPASGSGYRPSKPAHKIPYRNAATSLTSAVRAIDALVHDAHNGADVADFMVTEQGEDLGRLEAELSQAMDFLQYALNLVQQKKRAA